MKAFLSILTLFCLQSLVMAQNATLSVQGTVQKSSGAAIEDGNYEMTFKLYNSPTGGAPVWSETQTGIEIVGGVYSALLGTTEDLTASFDTTYYLGVSVDGSAELQPRARLTSAPYALSLIGQDNIFPSTGAIGAGTVSPDEGSQLHVKNDEGEGRLLLEGSTEAQLLLKAGAHAGIIQLEEENAKLNIHAPSRLELNGWGDMTLQADGQTRLHISQQGPVVQNGDLKFSEGTHIKYGDLNDWRLVEVNDFENGNTHGWICQENWNNTAPRETEFYTPNTKFFEGSFLGPKVAGWHALVKKFDLTGIPHTQVKVVFTYVFHHSWDPGEWGYALFSEFQNPTNGGYHVGFARSQFAGNAFSYGGGPSERVTMTANTSDDEFWINVSSGLNEAANNENFWIDDVEIWVK